MAGVIEKLHAFVTAFRDRARDTRVVRLLLTWWTLLRRDSPLAEAAAGTGQPPQRQERFASLRDGLRPHLTPGPLLTLWAESRQARCLPNNAAASVVAEGVPMVQVLVRPELDSGRSDDGKDPGAPAHRDPAQSSPLPRITATRRASLGGVKGRRSRFRRNAGGALDAGQGGPIPTLVVRGRGVPPVTWTRSTTSALRSRAGDPATASAARRGVAR